MDKKELTQKDFVGYEIISCDVKILVSKTFKSIRQQSFYEIKKVEEGPNAWCVTSKFPSKKIELHSAKDSEGNILSTNWNLIKEALTEIHINFNKTIKIGDTFKFHFDYTQPLDHVVVTETWFSKLYLLNIPKAFGTHCQHFSCTTEFEKKNIEVTKVIPESKIINSKNKITCDDTLRPYEFINISMLVKSGIFGIETSKNIEKVFWIIISAIAGILLANII